MKILGKITLLVMALGLLISGSAVAADDQDKSIFTLTPYVGGTFFDQDFDLDDGFTFGGRLGWQFLRSWRVEGDYGIADTDASETGTAFDIKHYGLDLVYDFAPGKKFNPYLLGGWAQFDADSEGMDTEHLNGWEVALGANWRLGGDNANYRALRFEVRDVIAELDATPAGSGATTHNFIATVGLQFGFGKSSRDTDLDGVRDRDDACADTPAGAVVDVAGCPNDADADGVYDGLDQCPETPMGATVDVAGCPSDSDSDGVLDGLDRCADTPAGATVDAAGCPLDSDGDGVYDGIDGCPDTPRHLQVNQAGCPIATTETEVQLLNTGQITTSQIVFASGSSRIDVAQSAILEEIGQTLSDWPALRIEVGGHTDNTGSAELNARLSESRAAAVRDHLLAIHPELDAARFTVKGYGEDTPVADNGTLEGRAANRRVEFTVLNTEVLKKEIEKRKLLER
ncbi:MAG: OmpA family protein [bacterium]|nr:OmpA family protein [bacterium]